MRGWLDLAGCEPVRDDYGWEVDGSDQYLAVPNLTSRPACKTVLHYFAFERNGVRILQHWHIQATLFFLTFDAWVRGLD